MKFPLDSIYVYVFLFMTRMCPLYLSSCEDGNINSSSSWICGWLFQSLSMKSRSLFNIHNLDRVTEPHPRMSLCKPDKTLQLTRISCNLTSSWSNFPHFNIVLDQLLSGCIRQDWVVSLFGIFNVVSEVKKIISFSVQKIHNIC